MEGFVVPKSTGTRRMGSGNSTSKSSVSLSRRSRPEPINVDVGLCLKSRANIDLDLGKLYRILPDRKSRSLGYLRVIDESGEDYLYPASYFRVVRLPAKIAKKIVQVF